jgi:predicted ATP-grasp superfamily ATP-dependent carboligase
MAGYSYTNGGGWTTCGKATVAAPVGTDVDWTKRADVRVWKWTGDLPENIDTPIMIATDDDFVLHVLARVLNRTDA